MTTQNVPINDTDLVCLYRYLTFDTDGVLLNSSEAPTYTGLNTMSVSGDIEKILGPGAGPPGAPNSSGERGSGSSTEIFHLPYSPSQSGNASGIDISSSQDFSFGGWWLISDTPTSSFNDLMGKWAVGSNLRSYAMSFVSGETPPTWQARATVGTSNGSSTATVDAGVTYFPGSWQHVVCTVDTSTGTDNVIVFVSGQAVATGSATVSPGTSGAHPPLRINANSAGGSEGLLNSSADDGVQAAETFLIRRTLAPEEVSGIYESGFQIASISDSDTHDSQKDTTAETTGDAELIVTAWNSEETANPSGYRHALSGIHPAFSGLMVSGTTNLDTLQIPDVKIEEVSDTVALTLHTRTDDNVIDNIRFWMSEWSGFSGLAGFQLTRHINPLWLPRLHLPSGSGVVASSLASADDILRSDGNTSISGNSSMNINDPLNEGDVSEYIYLAFDSNSGFRKGIFGPSGFKFRFTTDVWGTV